MIFQNAFVLVNFAGSRAWNSITLHYHWNITWSIAQSMYNKTFDCSFILPSVLWRICSRRLHLSSSIQDPIGYNYGMLFRHNNPVRIGIGTAIASVYNPNSSGALIVEGILDSMSAGILVYMALVDLIAADFLSKRMSCNFRLQVVSYFMLFLGAGLMSLLAIWAWYHYPDIIFLIGSVIYGEQHVEIWIYYFYKIAFDDKQGTRWNKTRQMLCYSMTVKMV